MPTSTRSEATDRSPQASDHNALALRTRGGTAKITRTREVIDRVVVEHLGSPPVTTTAEQQVIKTTRMERGKRNSGQALEAPGHQDSGSKWRQTSSVNNGSGNGAPSVTAPVEVPIENAAPNVQEEDEGVEGEGAPLMSTQDYMAEAEDLLANPMDTQEEAAPQGAPPAGDFDAAVAPRNEEAVAAQETGSAADAPEEAAEEPDAAAVPMVIVATEEVVEEEPVIEEPEEATRDAAALEEPAPAVSRAPAASSGGGGIFGSVAQVLHRVLHPSAGNARNGSGATEAEEAPVGMLAESAEAEAASAPQEQAASEEPPQDVREERRGRPPAKSKKSKGVAPVPDAQDLPTSADPAVAALNPDAAGEPPEPEAVAEALQKVSAASERKGKGSAKKSGRKGRQEAPAEEPSAEAEQAEQDVDAAEEEEAAAPAKRKSSSRATKKKKPAKVTAAAVEEEAQDNDTETTPVPVFPPETHLDVQAPRTPAKRSKHPSKPASEPASKRRKGRAQEYTVEEPEEEEEQIEEEQQMRVSPRAKPTAAAAAEKEPSRASHRGHAVPEAPKTQAAAPSKAAATKPAAAKAAPAKKTPAKAAPTKAAPTKATKATPAAKPVPVKAAPAKAAPAKAAPAKAAPARGRQAQGGKQLPKKASGVAPKPRKMRRNENYKSYILRVLKEIHPGESISKNAMDIMDAFTADMFNRITLEAARLCRQTNKQTMTSREVETAVRLLLPGELGKHALSEGRKAVVSGLR